MHENARIESEIIKSSGNVFLDIGFDDAQAHVLALRADLMVQLEKTLKARKMTQIKASKVLGVCQSTVSDLKRGKLSKFSLDTLVQFAAKLGKLAKIELSAGVRTEVDHIETDEEDLLDSLPKARHDAVLSQAEIAELIGTRAPNALTQAAMRESRKIGSARFNSTEKSKNKIKKAKK